MQSPSRRRHSWSGCRARSSVRTDFRFPNQLPDGSSRGMRLLRTMAMLVALVPLGSAQVHAASLHFTPATRSLLEAGDVVVQNRQPTKGGIAARAIGVIDASVDAIRAVLQRCEDFHEFMPRTEKSERREKNPTDDLCFSEVDMPFPFSNLWATMRVREEALPGGVYLRHFQMEEGTYDTNEGTWRVEPWNDDATRSLLTYEFEIEPSVALPDFIIRAAQKTTLPEVITAVRGRLGER